MTSTEVLLVGLLALIFIGQMSIMQEVRRIRRVIEKTDK
jgi:hypothetical protein